MSRPDLSFLLQSLEPAPDPQEHAEASPALSPADLTPQVDAFIMSEVDALIRELRNYQVELEAQNKVLRYSQAAAESASERFEALFAHVPLALMVLDEHDVVIQANAMAHRRFQPTEHDRPLVALTPFVAPEHLERVQSGFAQARASGHAEINEVLLTIGEADWLRGDLHIARIDSTVEGEAAQIQFLCAIIDQGPLLAERRMLRERNEQLHASEKRLESIINSSLDAILCVDQDQCITVFNPAASVLFQCPTAEALGSPLQRFLPEAEQVLAFAQLATQATLGEMTACTASGKELAIEVSVSFERHAGGGETTTLFARDLTGRKKAEAHRTELEAQLRESHKMRAMGTMAGGIAHDFNNILSAILGNVELAKADCQVQAPVLESLREIEKAGRRARDLVQQILTFSRNEPPRRIPVRLQTLLQDTERLVRVTLPPAIDLVLEPCGHLPRVLADPTQVEQAVLNLCTNAVQAMEGQRGQIHVSAEALLLEGAAAQRLTLPPGRYAVVQVQDNGPGMDNRTLQRIFEPFFTTKPVGQGTGLGLAVVHGVMRNHEGTVEVQSTPGAGSRFRLYFPSQEAALLPEEAPESVQRTLVLPPADAAFTSPPEVLNVSTPSAQPHAASAVPTPAHRTQNSAPTAAAATPAQHVMYVDDDEALVFLVQRLLKRLGYRITCFTDPQEALRTLRANPQDVDLIVTDYNMPGFSGVDLVREAKALAPDLPIALASGYVTVEIEQAARAAGAEALVHKPNDVDELVQTVQQLLASRLH